MKRRRAIGVLGGIVGGPLLVPEGAFAELVAWAERVRASTGAPAGADGATAQVAASLLTPPRARVMAGLAEVIIPATDTPGASEAGVTEFVAALVDGWLDDGDRDRFLAGLDTVDPAARDRFGRDFADCAPDEQAALVGDLDAELTRLRDDPGTDETRHFFHDVKRFSLTGYFTSEVGLEAIGYRTTFPAFEGCAPLTAAETGSSPGAEDAQADGRVPGEQDGASGSAGADPAGRHGSPAPGGGAHPVDSSPEVAAASAPVSEAGP